MASWRVLWWTMSAKETRTWRKEGKKQPKSAKTAVRSNMHRFETNHGQRYFSYAYSDLPHALGQWLGGKLRRFKEQGASSWWSNEGRTADFCDFGHVVVSYGAISSLGRQRDFKEGYHSFKHIKKVCLKVFNKIWLQMVEKGRSERMRTTCAWGDIVPLPHRFITFHSSEINWTLTI